MIFVAGRSQVLRTKYKCRVVVAHVSQLLVELNVHRVLQHQPSRIETMQTYSSLCRSPWSTSEPFSSIPLASSPVEPCQSKLHTFVQTFCPHTREIDQSCGIITRKLSNDRTLSWALKLDLNSAHKKDQPYNICANGTGCLNYQPSISTSSGVASNFSNSWRVGLTPSWSWLCVCVCVCVCVSPHVR